MLPSIFEFDKNTTKRELIERVGIEDEYDTALPQDWLNNFVAETGISYDIALAGLIWSYRNSVFGEPVALIKETEEALKIYNS